MPSGSTSGAGQSAHALLKQVASNLEQGLLALRRGERGRARELYLQAAYGLLKAAEASQEPLRSLCVKRAEDIRRLAQSMEVTRPAVPTAPPQEPAEGPSKGATWLVAERPTLRLSDVAGLEEVKEQIRLRMIYPFTHPHLATKFGIKQGGGILLFGPPGTGKTFLARAAAGELEAAFFVVKPSDLLSKWFGEAEQNVAALFAEARRYPRSVIFIDEIEGLMPKRTATQSSVMPRVVGQFLQELEGFQGQPPERALLFLGATNEPWMLDEAALRPGRFDVKLYVPLPDQPARLQMLQMHLKGKPLAPDVDLQAIAQRTEGYSGADLRALAEFATVQPFLDAVRNGVERPITLQDFEMGLERIKPSVSPKTVERFEAWKRQQGWG